MARTTVEIDEDGFDPVRASVAPGTTVVWRNVGATAHVVDSVQFHDAAERWQLRTDTLRTDDSVAYAFDDEGIYEYYCRLEGDDCCGAILVGDVSLDESLPCE